MANDRGGRGGSIIQISSATATIMLNDHAAYMGSKAGTDHVVRCVAHEFGAVGIRANSISPGLTDTPMTAEAKTVPGLFEAFRAGYPLGRWGTSEDIAAAAVWLASDECFMTGENLQVNGGLTLRRNPTREEIAASVGVAGGAS
jgi:NAD(P)-dependent dehydrogenase (short-subunit alcohol dehydrogenase family)